MPRIRHLIAYDIADPKRLRQVCTVMEAYGTRLQYSVFLCDLSGAELYGWRAAVLTVVDLKKDSVVVIALGQPAATSIEVLGVPRSFPVSGPVIV